MSGKLLFLCVLLLVAESSLVADIHTAIEINGVIVRGGLVYVAVYPNENDYKNETAFAKFTLQPDNTTLTYFLDLPEGEYVVSAYQDKNGDEKLNSGLFGMPSEPVGKTNYNLRGAPGSFNKLKAPVNHSSTRLIVNMGKVRLL